MLTSNRLFAHFGNKFEQEEKSSIGKCGPKTSKWQKPKFPNLLILEHLKSHFIKPQLTK